MKKVLFVGPYRQKDSWGRAARDYICGILTNPDISLSTRPIYYSNVIENNIDSKIISCENSYNNSYDYVLQYGFPSSFNTGGLHKNIGILNIEFSKGQSDINTLLLNRLDEIYVSTVIEKSILVNMGVTKPISVVPRPINLEAIAENITKKENIFPKYINSTFKFYSFCSAQDRDNLEILITAFHLAFGEQDRVSLVLSPFVESHEINSYRSSIEKICSKIKTKLRTNTVFKNEIIIPNSYSLEKEIIIHNSCNCYINITSGYNYDPAVVSAMYLGKTPVILSNTGLESLIEGEKSGFIVKSENHPILLENAPLSTEYDLFNANYFWKKPNIQSLIDTLKKAYFMYKNNKTEYKNKQNYGSKKINDFSYEKIGNSICL
jgi:hypothetical protein